MSIPPRASLSRVVEDLGETFLEVVAADAAARAKTWGSVVIYDRHHAAYLPNEAVVLGVGVHGTHAVCETLRTLGDEHAAALVVRAPVERAPEILRAVDESGVSLLALTQGASWLRLADVLRTVLANDDLGDESPSALGNVPSGDLFHLANAIAALIDAPITIEDRKFEVLAFSGRQDEADAARLQTILDRRVPGTYIREDEDRGVIEALYRNVAPVYIEPSPHSERTLPRLAIAVRAGDEILGSIWAAVRGPATPEREEALSDAAKLVALHLLRWRAGADVDRRLRSDLVATALEGGARSSQALSRLGLHGKTLAVVALGLLDDGADDSGASRRVAERRIADALAIHLTALAPRSEVALIGEVAYGLIPVGGDGARDAERATKFAADFLRRTSSRASAVIGVGPLAREAGQLGRSRMQADRALRVLRAQARPGAVATSEEVHFDALLLELGDLALGRDDPASAPIARLREYDARRNGKLMSTLTLWLDAFGDTNAAAASAGVHPNTFRYRLKRVSDVACINLHNPDERLAVMLQLRLSNDGSPGGGESGR